MTHVIYIVHIHLGFLNPLSGLLLDADVSQSTLSISFSDSEIGEIIQSSEYLLNYTGIISHAFYNTTPPMIICSLC